MVGVAPRRAANDIVLPVVSTAVTMPVTFVAIALIAVAVVGSVELVVNTTFTPATSLSSVTAVPLAVIVAAGSTL